MIKRMTMKFSEATHADLLWLADHLQAGNMTAMVAELAHAERRRICGDEYRLPSAVPMAAPKPAEKQAVKVETVPEKTVKAPKSAPAMMEKLQAIAQGKPVEPSVEAVKQALERPSEHEWLDVAFGAVEQKKEPQGDKYAEARRIAVEKRRLEKEALARVPTGKSA